MKSLSKVREELRDIRYYYAHKEMFDESVKMTGAHELIRKAERYNAAMCTAPPRLYEVYVGLYVYGNTQESLSETLCYSPEHIQRQHKKILLYLQTKIGKEEYNHDSQECTGISGRCHERVPDKRVYRETANHAGWLGGRISP